MKINNHGATQEETLLPPVDKTMKTMNAKSTKPSVRLLSVLWRDSPNTDPFGTPGAGRSRLLSILTVLTLLVIWWIVTKTGIVTPLFLPSPASVIHQFFNIMENGFAGATLQAHIIASMERVFGAFILAAITAVPVGIFIGCNRWVRGIFDPLIEFYRPLPPLAYLPLIIIWLGIDEASKVTLIYLAMFAPIAISARAGVKSVRIEQIQAAYSMGASSWQVIRHIIVISALPEILTGMRIAVGFGWTTLVAAEMVAAEAGVGFMVLNASEFLATDVVVMGIILIGIIAYIFDRGMLYLEKKLVPWKGY